VDAAPDAALAPPAPKWQLFAKVSPLTTLFALAKFAVPAIGFADCGCPAQPTID
jgi:hypothetical protein